MVPERVPVGTGGREERALPRIQSAAVATVVVVLTLGVWWWTSLPAGPPAVVTTESSPPPSVPDVGPGLLVHVAGEVRRPGVVRLPEGARVVDAIEAAGGATDRAVLAGVNLAAAVSDGAQIVVPSRDAATAFQVAADDGFVAINTADVAELETLPGVGPVLAERIASHRDAHGPFVTVEDLLDVAGIGESILGRLRPLVRVP